MNQDDARQKITELVKDGRICMLTTADSSGRLVSRPMGLQDVEFDGDLWFFVEEDSPKVAEIRAEPRVNVSFSNSNDAWVSIAGTAEVVHDRRKSEQLWSPFLRGWFPDGPDTPGIALIKVHADTAEYWDSPHSHVVTMIEYAAAAALKKRPPEGENEVVDLP